MDLAEPRASREAMQMLAELQKYRGLELDGVGVSRPSADEFEAIQFAIRRQDAEWVYDAVRESVVNATILEPVDDSDQNRTASLIDPLGPILGLPVPGQLGEPTPAQRAEARQRFERAFAERVIAPLLAQAEAAVDPVERSDRLRLAQLVDLLNGKILQAREQARRLLGAGDPSARGKDNTVQEILAIDKEITSLAASLHKSRRIR
jgi:hypothetical protein